MRGRHMALLLWAALVLCLQGVQAQTSLSPSCGAAVSGGAGGSHSVALLQDGTVVSFGLNTFGQLGDGTNVTRLAPVAVKNLTGVRAVAAGGAHTVALLEDGTLRAWGQNLVGQLGDGTTINRWTPGPVPGITGVRAISVGYQHSLILLQDGTVRGFGGDSYGQLCAGGTASSRTTPVVAQGLAGVRAVAAGYSHSMALLEDGTVRACGANSYGQLGDGTNTQRTLPVVVQGLSGVAAVAGGNHHSVALLQDGTVRSCGRGQFGQLGDNTTADRWTPVVTRNLANVGAVAAGSGHTIVLLKDGTARALGRNDNGQVGDGSITNRWLPVVVQGLAGARAISAGQFSSLAMLDSGTVRGWGSNYNRELGVNTTITSYRTPAVTAGFDTCFACLPACGTNSTCTAANTCTCNTAGYTGTQCDTPVCSPDCGTYGNCTAPNTCTCAAGYTGAQCDTPANGPILCGGDAIAVAGAWKCQSCESIRGGTVPDRNRSACYSCTSRSAVNGGPGMVKSPLTGVCVNATSANGCKDDDIATSSPVPCRSCSLIRNGTVPNLLRTACVSCTDATAIGGGAGKIKAPSNSSGVCVASGPDSCAGDEIASRSAGRCLSCATIAPGTVASSDRSQCVFCTSTAAPNGGPGRIKYPALDPAGSCIAATDAVNGCKGDSVAVAAPAQCMSCESVRGGTVPDAARSACQSCLTATAFNGGLGTVKAPLSSTGVCVNATSANGCKGDEIATSNPVPCRSCSLIRSGTVANSLRSACVFCTSTGAPNGGPGKVKYPPLDPAGSCVAANGPNGCTGDAVAVGEPIQCKSCSLISANTVANTARSACVFCTDPTAPNGGVGKVKSPNDSTGACVSAASTCTGDSISVKGSCVSCHSLSPGTVPNADRTVCYSCLDSRAINGGPGKVKSPLDSSGRCVPAASACTGDAIATGEATPCKSCQVVKPGSVPNANRTACYYCTDANAIGGGAGMIKAPLSSAGVCVSATDPVLGCQGDAAAVGEPTPCKSCQVVRSGTVPNAARSICWSCTDSRAVNGGPGKTKWPLSFSGTCVPNVPVDCVGAWTFTSTCSAECGGGMRPGVFVVTQPAMVNGRPCEVANGTQNGSIPCNAQPCVGPGPNP